MQQAERQQGRAGSVIGLGVSQRERQVSSADTACVRPTMTACMVWIRGPYPSTHKEARRVACVHAPTHDRPPSNVPSPTKRGARGPHVDHVHFSHKHSHELGGLEGCACVCHTHPHSP
jgi:hypothetical protein